MSEELETKIHRLIDECWNQGNLDALDAHIPPTSSAISRPIQPLSVLQL